MYPNQGYGYGIPPTNYGYGMPNPGMGMGMGMGTGMGMGMGMGHGFQGNYMFNQQMIDMQARNCFMKYDFNRNGMLGYQELRLALNEFTALNGQMPIMDPDLMMLMGIFDVDGTGQIDFFEFKMMLEHLGGIRTYDRMFIQQNRMQRGMRMQQYNSWW